MSDAVVLYELRAPAAIVTLNRPDRRNAISRTLIAGVTEAMARARDESAARCVILTGAGSSFCAGMDLAELSESIQRKADADSIWNDALNLSLGAATPNVVNYQLKVSTQIATFGIAYKFGGPVVARY